MNGRVKFLIAFLKHFLWGFTRVHYIYLFCVFLTDFTPSWGLGLPGPPATSGGMGVGLPDPHWETPGDFGGGIWGKQGLGKGGCNVFNCIVRFL